MARKVFCDGCDKDITDIAYIVKVNVMGEYDVTSKEYSYDLCNSCRREMYPPDWPRPAKLAPTASDFNIDEAKIKVAIKP